MKTLILTTENCNCHRGVHQEKHVEEKETQI